MLVSHMLIENIKSDAITKVAKNLCHGCTHNNLQSDLKPDCAKTILSIR